MNRKEFDKTLQERLNNYSSHYSDQVWKNLEAELDRNRAVAGFSLLNKKLLSILFLIAGVSGIAALSYFNLFHVRDKVNTPAPIEKQEYQQPVTPEPESSSVATVALNEINKPVIEKSFASNKSSKRTNTFLAHRKGSNTNIGGTVKNNNLSSSQFTGVGSTLPAPVIADNIENDTRDYIEFTQEISPQKIMSVSKTNKNSRSIDKGLYDPKRNCPSFNTNAPGYFVEIFGSPDYSFKSYNNKDIESASYNTARNKSESSLLGYSLGFRGGIEFRNGLSLKTGLTYSNIREEFSYTQYNVDIPGMRLVKVYDGVSSGGTSIVVYDTVRFVEKGNLTTIKTNSIKSFEVPLLLGYQLDFTSWTLQFNTGVALQLANIQSGTVLDPQLDVVSYGADNDYQLYKKHWGLSVYTGIQFGYKIGPSAQVYIEPNARYYPKSITVDEHQVAQKLLNLGASLGVKYRL